MMKENWLLYLLEHGIGRSKLHVQHAYLQQRLLLHMKIGIEVHATIPDCEVWQILVLRMSELQREIAPVVV